MERTARSRKKSEKRRSLSLLAGLMPLGAVPRGGDLVGISIFRPPGTNAPLKASIFKALRNDHSILGGGVSVQHGSAWRDITPEPGFPRHPKSARKNGSGDVDAIFCASRGGRVVGGRYYLHPGTAGYADRGFDWRGRAEGTAWQRPRKRPGGRPRRTYAS